MELYTLIEKGFKESGSSWARYLDAVGQECRISVMRGLDVEEEIQEVETTRHEELRWWNALSREEQQRLIKEEEECMARLEERDGLGAWLASGAKVRVRRPEDIEDAKPIDQYPALQGSKLLTNAWSALRSGVASLLGVLAGGAAKPAQPMGTKEVAGQK